MRGFDRSYFCVCGSVGGKQPLFDQKIDQGAAFLGNLRDPCLLSPRTAAVRIDPCEPRDQAAAQQC
jgi:hypothetical protein